MSSNKERARRALSKTSALGIPSKAVIPVLKRLLKLYGGQWELIEDDSYRALIDAYYESENGEADGNACKESGADSGKKLKRPRLEENEENVSSKGKSIIDLDIDDLDAPEHEGRDSSNDLSCYEQQRAETRSQAKKELLQRDDSTAGQANLRNDHSISNFSRDSLENLSGNCSIKGKHSQKGLGSNSGGQQCGTQSGKVKLLTNGGSAVGSSSSVRAVPDSSFIETRTVQNSMDRPAPSRRDSRDFNRELAGYNGAPNKSTHLNSSEALRLQNGVAKKKKISCKLEDIAKGSEKVKIPLVDEFGKDGLPKFVYMPQNTVYQSAFVQISLARIADADCCSGCSGDCLSSSIPCACARETGGEFAYTQKGLLKEEFLEAVMSMKLNPQEHHFVYCQDCPLEKTKNLIKPDKCKGHPVRKFIKECWRKCGCDMNCGNRVVQRGININLEVFMTAEGKGWGVRTLEDLPKGTFVCEYVGEILTNMELYERNIQNLGTDRHTYPVTLDADWGSEKNLKDEEALCLDATFIGNVARFINHRCGDPTLTDIPVEIETPDRHYYHLAFFTTRDVRALEELTWDYGIDFDDHTHPIKAFRCTCGSQYCRNVKQKGARNATGRR